MFSLHKGFERSVIYFGADAETSLGRTEIVRATQFEVANRGTRGTTIISKGTLKSVTPDPIELNLPGSD